MMPAVQVGPGLAVAAGRASSATPELGVAPGNAAGAGFGKVMKHALSQVSGATEGSAQAPVAGDGKDAAGSTAAAAGVGAQANSQYISDTAAKSNQGAAATGGMPGAQAQSGTATSAKTVEALAGRVPAVAQQMAATAAAGSTNIGTNTGEGVSSSTDASGGAAGAVQGSSGGAAGTAGKKTDGKKAEEKSQLVATGLLVNGAGILPAAASVVVAAHPAAVPARTVAGVKEARDGGPAAIVVPRKAVLVAGGVASGSGMQAAGAAAGDSNMGQNVPGAIAWQAHHESRAQAAMGADIGSGASPNFSPGSGPNPDAGNGYAVHAQSGGAAGSSGLTASHVRDGVSSSASVNGNGSASGGFTATLLQVHAGNGTGNGFPSGLGVSAGAGAGPGAATLAHGGVQHAAGSAGGIGVANPYARMDEPQRATLVYASPQKMSVAVNDPGLGNFQVRAHGVGTQVAASLATSSAVTHAQLSGHLPALTAFLQEQRVDLSRVTVVQQSLLGADAGPRDFGGHQQQGGSGGRGTRAQAGRVGRVAGGGAGGLQGLVSSAETAGTEAGMDLGGNDAAGASTRRTAALDGGAMSSVDVHA